MGLSASQGRLLLLTAKQSDLEFRAQQISQKRLVLAQQLEEISKEYEDATSNRVMSIDMYQEGVDEDGKKVKTSGNLTYKNLISGTLAQGLAGSAGIKPGVYDIETSSNKAYRLVDTSGAIVVSSKDEIPTEFYDYQQQSSNSTEHPTGFENSNVYKATTTNQGGTVTSSKNIVVLSKDSALGKVLGDKFDSASCDFGTIKQTSDGSNETQILKYGDKWYTLDGAEITDKTTATYAFTSLGHASFATEVPQSTSFAEQKLNYQEPVIGDDGIYTIKDQNGKTVYRYVVDEGLKYGANNNSADPNYLQDCIRNGKYLIQQYSKNDDNTGSATWDLISWDATSNISDRYYDEDDAAAKAVYDRKQTEIQNADKKLELELDNVESQRNAVKTEIESVEKVINDNIDKSFKTFA